MSDIDDGLSEYEKNSVIDEKLRCHNPSLIVHYMSSWQLIPIGFALQAEVGGFDSQGPHPKICA